MLSNSLFIFILNDILTTFILANQNVSALYNIFKDVENIIISKRIFNLYKHSWYNLLEIAEMFNST